MTKLEYFAFQFSHLTHYEQLQRVNDEVNKMEYVADEEDKDYWQDPEWTLENEAGDCEDLAILKYFTLRELGYPTSDMKLVYVEQLDGGAPHVVLLVGTFILDNLHTEVMSTMELAEVYVPVYSFDEHHYYEVRQYDIDSHRWRHILAGVSSNLSKWKKCLDEYYKSVEEAQIREENLL